MQTVAGLPTARGLVAGPVFLYRGDGDIPVPEYRIGPERVKDELMRLRHAQVETGRELQSLTKALNERMGRDDVNVFDCHLMILRDPQFEKDMMDCIQNGLVNAESAVKRTVSRVRAKFEVMNDPYFRERVRDLDDIERRLLKVLIGFSGSPHLELRAPAIVVADDLTPSETVQLPREFVLGFATNGGSATSHVALLARALGIPAVTGLGDITSRVKPGMQVLLDGTSGTVTVNPDAATVESFNELVARQRRTDEAAAADGVPMGTLKDGSLVRLYANLHPGVSTDGIRELGASGVGLYRSEYLWLNREGEPTEEEQFAAYCEVADFVRTLAPDATVTIRTLDIGGDKLVRGVSSHEANPFLGNRSIRYLLSHREVFRTQLRAILRASARGNVRMMYPMVSCVEELREAATELASVRRELDAAGVAYDRSMPVGIMIEVPSAALNAEGLARQVDFFSIGTNDLVQYTMAADRGNESVAYLYQPLNPAVLHLIRLTIDGARKAGISVSVCGESAADPLLGVLWAAMGIDQLSMSATYIPVIAKVLRRLTRADLDEYAALANGMDSATTADERLLACRDWLLAKIPDLDDLLI